MYGLLYDFLFIICSHIGKYYEKYWCWFYCGVTCLAAIAPLLGKIACIYYMTQHGAIYSFIFLVRVERVKFPTLVESWLGAGRGD